MELHETQIMCPYCGETLDVLIDPEDVGQAYTEDCQVCCRPIDFIVTTDEHGEILVRVHDDT